MSNVQRVIELVFFWNVQINKKLITLSACSLLPLVLAWSLTLGSPERWSEDTDCNLCEIGGCSLSYLPSGPDSVWHISFLALQISAATVLSGHKAFCTLQELGNHLLHLQPAGDTLPECHMQSYCFLEPVCVWVSRSQQELHRDISMSAIMCQIAVSDGENMPNRPLKGWKPPEHVCIFL